MPRFVGANFAKRTGLQSSRGALGHRRFDFAIPALRVRFSYIGLRARPIYLIRGVADTAGTLDPLPGMPWHA